MKRTRSTTRLCGRVPLALGTALLWAAGLACDPSGSGPPLERLTQVLLRPDALERAEPLTALLDELGPDALPDVWRTYRSVWSHLTPMEVVLFAHWWASFDPERALEASRSFGLHSAPARDEVIRSWAQRDPEAARRYLQSRDLLESEPWAAGALVLGWWESGGPGAWMVVDALSVGDVRETGLQTLADQLVLHGGAVAVERWMESPPRGLSSELVEEATPYLAGALALRDPAAAGAWVEHRLEAPPAASMVRRVAERWAERDAPATLTWLGTLPEEVLSGRVREVAFGQWLRRDPDAALSWAAALPPTPSHEAVRTVYVVALSREDPERAATLVDTIHDPSRRNHAAVMVARAWLPRAPAAAHAWLEELELDPEVRERILTQPRRGRKPARASREGAAASAGRDPG